jgi:hypothetical protein
MAARPFALPSTGRDMDISFSVSPRASICSFVPSTTLLTSAMAASTRNRFNLEIALAQ